MFAEKIGLCKFYEFIRALYDEIVRCNMEYRTYGDGFTALEFKPEQMRLNNAQNNTLQIIIHGGGFIYGSPVTVAKFSENLCNALGNDVIALKYPLAPENKFPEPLVYVTRALKMFCNRYDNVHLVGVSAGANLALSASLLLTDIGEKHKPKSLTLIGGPYSFNACSYSYRKNGDGPKLTRSMIRQYWSLYITGDQDSGRELDRNIVQHERSQKVSSLQDLYQQSKKYLVYCAPIDSTFIFNLPRTTILVAEQDTLMSDSITLYRKLKNERSEVILKVYQGPHIHLAEENGKVEQDVIKTIEESLRD
jgi:acetyl esterase/lipase